MKANEYVEQSARTNHTKEALAAAMARIQDKDVFQLDHAAERPIMEQ